MESSMSKEEMIESLKRIYASGTLDCSKEFYDKMCHNPSDLTKQEVLDVFGQWILEG